MISLETAEKMLIKNIVVRSVNVTTELHAHSSVLQIENRHCLS